MASIDTPEAASRLARAIASDISAYNGEKIIEGLKEDTFFDVLAGELQEGLALYRSRVSADLQQNTNFFWCAIIDRIISRKADIETPIW